MKKILFVLMVGLLLTGCTKNTITEGDFEKGLNNFIESEVNTDEYEVKLNDGKMIVTYWDEEYTLEYDLRENPTITYEFEVKKGISYDDYFAKNQTLSLPMLGYFAIANTYGVEAVDSYTYFAESYLYGMFDAVDEEKESYIIVDEDEEFDSESKVILSSEFGEKVIDYIEYTYDKPIKIEDEKYNTYTYELEVSCEDDVCVFNVILTINPEGEFAELIGYADELAKESMDENITPENADYNIELVVGQSVTVSGKNLNGYDYSGMDVIEVDYLDSDYIFKATKAGIANGNFYIGEEDLRTFYITVTDGSKKTEDISITVK